MKEQARTSWNSRFRRSTLSPCDQFLMQAWYQNSGRSRIALVSVAIMRPIVLFCWLYRLGKYVLSGHQLPLILVDVAPGVVMLRGYP
jgi:hypothetical protein